MSAALGFPCFNIRRSRIPEFSFSASACFKISLGLLVLSLSESVELPMRESSSTASDAEARSSVPLLAETWLVKVCFVWMLQVSAGSLPCLAKTRLELLLLPGEMLERTSLLLWRKTDILGMDCAPRSSVRRASPSSSRCFLKKFIHFCKEISPSSLSSSFAMSLKISFDVKPEASDMFSLSTATLASHCVRVILPFWCRSKLLKARSRDPKRSTRIEAKL
mmetsp:Transcript_26292/g.47400  ORF Transcript_26292/g.47400 Transcript_26292/m.47400 type:complete len:221 (-) Transcript_26292:790-1452(-)